MTASRAAIDRYAKARRALDANSITEYGAGICDETPEFLELNQEVADAEAGVPWWRRALIDRRVLRELDYWAAMDEIKRSRRRAR
jgi:hypothetical protein